MQDMNKLYVGTYIFRDIRGSVHIQNIYAVATSEYRAKALIADFMPEWDWWGISIQAITEYVELDEGLYNPEEVPAYHKENSYEVFVEV